MDSSSVDRNSTILIIDDVELNVQVAREMLRKEGYTVRAAYSGAQALKDVKEKKPDLILVDIMMPEMDGFTVVERIKSNRDFSDIPIIFLTALNDSESLSRAFELGAVDYITKPFRINELRVRVRTHLELMSTRRRLQEANAAKDKFFSIIAHDLRSPFTALVGMSRYLVDEIDSLDRKTAKEFLEAIHKSSKNAFNLLENLLEWSRIQTGRVVLVPEEIDLARLLDENLSLFESNFAGKDLEVENRFRGDEKAWADENTIHTVLRNLISNAIKFTPRGGKISFFSEKTPSELKIGVQDNGVGMSVEKQRELFRVDVRTSSRGTEDESGTGLGLVLCREFVEKNGGRIRIESEINRGSLIEFSLPLSPPREDAG
jgi:signal transduction histidine kinase